MPAAAGAAPGHRFDGVVAVGSPAAPHGGGDSPGCGSKRKAPEKLLSTCSKVRILQSRLAAPALRPEAGAVPPLMALARLDDAVSVQVNINWSAPVDLFCSVVTAVAQLVAKMPLMTGVKAEEPDKYKTGAPAGMVRAWACEAARATAARVRRGARCRISLGDRRRARVCRPDPLA